MMDRRAFVAGAVGILAAPLGGGAEERGKVSHVGILGPRNRSDAAPFLHAFLQGLRELGWVEGQNIVIEYRFAEGNLDRLADLAAELVRLKVDIILARSTPPAVAAKSATRTIPIVMATSADPVELGLVTSLARPGGNVTGLSFSVGLDVVGKELELLKETVPKVRRVAVLSNPGNPGNVQALKNVKSTARSLGVELLFLEARGPNEFEGTFAARPRDGSRTC
jgi:ABC-type uncharacterized transport system substrate-binding protein